VTEAVNSDYPSDEELFALLDRASEEANQEVEELSQPKRETDYLQSLLMEVKAISRSACPRPDLAKAVILLLSRILKNETGQSQLAEGFGTMASSLGGGSFALRLFSDLFFRAQRVCSEAQSNHSSSKHPSSKEASSKEIIPSSFMPTPSSVVFEHSQVIFQLEYVVRWYVNRANTLATLAVDPRTKVSRDSQFAISAEVSEMAGGIPCLKLFGAACIAGFAQQPIALKLVVKENKKSLLLRSGWEAWAENLQAYFDVRTAPRAASLYFFVPESPQTYIDYFELCLPLASLDVSSGIHSLQPVLRIEDQQGRAVQRVLPPVEINFQVGWRNQKVVPTASQLGIGGADWSRGDRIYLTKASKEEDRLLLKLNLDLVSHEQDKIKLGVRLFTVTESWARKVDNSVFEIKRKLNLERAFHSYVGLSFEVDKSELIAEDVNNLSFWEIRLLDEDNQPLLIEFVAV